MFLANDRTSKSRRIAARAALAILPLTLCACAPLTPHWDAKFGDAVRIAVAQQTLNPEASRNTEPVNGIDGRPAAEAVKRYQKSFQDPPPPSPLFQILSGTGSGQ